MRRKSVYGYVLRELRVRKGTWQTVARAARVPLPTLKKIATRESQHPSVVTVERIARYFDSHPMTAQERRDAARQTRRTRVRARRRREAERAAAAKRARARAKRSSLSTGSAVLDRALGL
jgi:hypothetical protein